MIPALLLASLTPMLATSVAAASDSPPTVRASKNGEFLANHYPPGALKRGEQGRVAFRITVEPSGSLGTCDVTESSGFAALDTETCEILLNYARLEPVRNMDGRAIRATQSGFIVWRSPATATVASATPTAKTMPKPDEIVCRRDQVTGSLVAKVRQCMSRADWKKQEQMWKDEIDRIQFRGNCDGRGMPCVPEG